MFSLPIVTVPMLGKPEASAKGTVSLTIDKLEVVVLAATSKSVALVRIIEVAESEIRPFRVVWSKLPLYHHKKQPQNQSRQH